MPFKKILVIDDKAENLKLINSILSVDYRVMLSLSGKEGIELAIREKPSLILLDIMMPEMNGYEVCRILKKNKETENIPIIFVTAMTEEVDENKGFSVGCVDYITKPISRAILKARVKSHLALVKVTELEKTNRAAIYMLGEAGHYHDDCTGNHIWRMSEYSYLIAKQMNCSPEFCYYIKYAAAMHDTGKIGIPDSVLKKTGKLTSEEWEIMKQHPQIGYDILRKNTTPLFAMAAEIALYHHEKWDGSGYPYQLEKNEIPLSARIVSVSDVFDALTTVRPYKKAWDTEKSIDEIKTLSGKHFDPNVVRAFMMALPKILEVKKQLEDKFSS